MAQKCQLYNNKAICPLGHSTATQLDTWVPFCLRKSSTSSPDIQPSFELCRTVDFLSLSRAKAARPALTPWSIRASYRSKRRARGYEHQGTAAHVPVLRRIPGAARQLRPG